MNGSSRVVVFSLGMTVVGIFLCISWLLLMIRSFKYHVYLIFSDEIEEKFLSNSVKTVSRGGDFAEGREVELQIGNKSNSLQMSRLERLRVRYTSYLIIGILLVVYILIFVSSWGSSS
jgi:hypothetical protein